MQAPSNLQFEIATLMSTPEGSLKSITPNEEGLFCNIPVMVFGEPSRNGSNYEPTSGLACLRDPKSMFYLRLTEGGLEGEWCHPLTGKKDFDRAVVVDRTKVSHYIRAIRTKPIEGGRVVVYADIGAMGPYGQCLKDSFADPNQNTAFSIRAITSPINGNPALRQMRVIITFDAESSPGFKMASKRFMLNTEGMQVTVDDILGLKDRTCIVTEENIKDQQILDIFQSNSVVINNTFYPIFDEQTNLLRTDFGPGSLAHSPTFELLKGL